MNLLLHYNRMVIMLATFERYKILSNAYAIVLHHVRIRRVDGVAAAIVDARRRRRRSRSYCTANTAITALRRLLLLLLYLYTHTVDTIFINNVTTKRDFL